ncbi:Hypothetical protein FKW44_011838, partial [Caligus rogercresseyi]
DKRDLILASFRNGKSTVEIMKILEVTGSGATVYKTACVASTVRSFKAVVKAKGGYVENS